MTFANIIKSWRINIISCEIMSRYFSSTSSALVLKFVCFSQMNNYNAILIVINFSIKKSYILTNLDEKRITKKWIARQIFHNVSSFEKLATIFTLENDSLFIPRVYTNLWKRLKISFNVFMFYNLKTNEKISIMKNEKEKYLHIFIQYQKNYW